MATGGTGRRDDHSPKWPRHNRESPEMKYLFIEKYRAEFSIKAMYRVLQIACNAGMSGVSISLICDIAVRKASMNEK